MQCTRPWFDLGWEDPLEKEMATNSSILAWRIPWTEDPGRLQSMELQRVRRNLVTKPPPTTKPNKSLSQSILQEQFHHEMSASSMDVRVGLLRRLSEEELMLLNCGVGEGS